MTGLQVTKVCMTVRSSQVGTQSQTVRVTGRHSLTVRVVAAVCLAGSLYFSEVAHFPPCHLCWLQRFCMYPLVPILGFAAWRHATRVTPYAAALALIGACISTYHVALERHPEWESSVCDPKNPCTLIWVKRLGYLTIPTMALSGFALIVTLLAVSRAGDRLAASEPDRSDVHGLR